jgi:hypothetical protein
MKILFLGLLVLSLPTQAQISIAEGSSNAAVAIASLTDPAKLNQAKSDKVTERARVFAKGLYDAKLLSEEGWKKINSQ